jgi:hypothetical protein
MIETEEHESVPSCPRCGCSEAIKIVGEEQRDPPDYLRCASCRIERTDLEPHDEADRWPVPPCPNPKCRSTEVRFDYIPTRTQLSFFGPSDDHLAPRFWCLKCGRERDDYDPEEEPYDDDDEEIGGAG